jgi:hypothetical protein
MKVNETQLWQTETALSVANRIKGGAKLLTKITSVNRNTGAWRFEVSLAYAGHDGVEVISLTYWLAACTGASLRNGQISNGEVGTERNFVVAYQVWQVLARFGYVERQFTNQRIYQAI